MISTRLSCRVVNRPMFRLWLSTNHRPTAHANDTALWDRSVLSLSPSALSHPGPDEKSARSSARSFWHSCLGSPRVSGWQRDGLRIAGRCPGTDDIAPAWTVASFLRECCHVREDLSVPCKEP